jgi:hypothetical protein
MRRSLLPAFPPSLGLLLLGLLLLGLSASAQAQQWREYRPDGEGYRIDFPGTPAWDTRNVSTNAGIMQLRTSTMGIGDQAFIAIRSDYPQTMDMGDANASLDRARNGSLSKVNGRLRSEERFTMGDAPARHLLFDIPEGDQVADAILVMQGHHLLQAVYVGPSSPQETPEARRFLSSFALVP